VERQGCVPTSRISYETYSTSGGSILKNQVGNKDLRPAVATEDEFGINAAFMNRFNLELVQANRVTKGAFLAVPLVGSAVWRFQPAGSERG